MKDTLHNFLKTLNMREHVLRLIDHVEHLTVKISTGEDTLLLAFHQGTAVLDEYVLNSAVECEIYGDTLAIQKLLEGRDSLRRLYRSGQLKVKASFRTVLLLESVFYLTPEYQQIDLIS